MKSKISVFLLRLMFHEISFYLLICQKLMFIVDSIVFLCFLIIPETGKPEYSSLFSFLKLFTMYDHLIALMYIFQSKISLKTIPIN